MGRLGNLAERGAVPWSRSHGEWKHPPTALGAAAKPPTVLLKKRRAARIPLPQSVSPSPIPSPTLEVNGPELSLGPPGWRQHPPLVPTGARGACGHSPRRRNSSPRARTARRPRPMSPRAGLVAPRSRGRASEHGACPGPATSAEPGWGWGGGGGGRRAWAGAPKGAEGAKRMTRLGSAPLERSRPQRNETN